MPIVGEKTSAFEEPGQDPVPELQVKQGPCRPYVVSEPSEKLGSLRTVHEKKERIMVALLAVFTGMVRFYNLSWPNSVIFDEVHFGKFASHYIKNNFFMDVHPPLAKMMFAWIASLVGYQGDFDFETIGELFPATVPYVLMRSLAATAGALTVVMLYFTLRASGVRVWVAVASAICFAVENSYVTISRYILLDAPLMFFISASVYCFKRYELYPTNTCSSLKYLVATGVFLGLAASSKWVGLFTVAWVGVLCLWRLWFFLGDLSKPVCSTFKIAAIKGTILLGIPLVLYTFFFYMHFATLTNDGEGAGFFSPEFRSSLKGNTIPQNVMAEVGTGSVVTIRHTGTMGGYLHSHPHDFPAGSQQQQITLYPHLDANNEWYIMLYDQPNNTVTSFENLPDGTKIRLLHPLTYRRLHSHDHKPPVSENSDWQKEVSCYGFEGFDGDANDDWIIEIDKDESVPGPAQDHVRALETKFRLRHAMMNCYLFSHEVKLPKWGYDQQEVTCAYSGQPSLTLWAVEQSYNEFLPKDTELISYKPSNFWQKLVEYHQKMWHINKNLVDSHVYESLPTSWPFMLRGIGYWSQENRHVYLLGNAILWWSVTGFIFVFALLVAGELLAWQLGKPILQDSYVVNFHVQVIHYLLGYMIHLAPSFLMQRQMFLHHYLPAYYFGILAFGHALDILVTYVLRRQKTVGYIVIGAFVLSCLYFFKSYTPIIYGLPWTKTLCEKSQWLSGWDYACGNYLDTLEQYTSVGLKENVMAQSTAAV
ncbi:probable Dolichyl-phosphate-mannose--protein mannosyltransferase 1 [Zygosaccharomyces bailii]|nr:probable Dolichyl-phosphate-mannose--protein mannosyltransferase 1 [Zygosaccharomyces bailii ISA1307]SJM84942.1 probable Dolichyl-phosphate-mannose--protein mannosyltransferase 1 [Zygosaccharomyces bailii]